MIRPATPADSPALLEIWNPIIRDTAVTFNSVEKTAADVAQMIADKAAAGHGFLVAEQDGRVQGFASYGQFRAGIGYAHTMEHTIVLGPQARGRGLGRALMTAIEDHARAGGAHSIFAGVSAENPDGRRFHLAMGYAEIATLPAVGHKFGRWIDLHLLQKILT
ncbi:N-acetyltransferase [Pseudorhodobacter sp. E13]|uniref:GNAT family N-acetyltransferase n=1 Tax=Pseudorhodobacter sp. E13 TaxID=2487931 RepID=UPI000F8DFC48|nr:GNAT family N-acetyltransferase [Pseudorhodobacter sp. E13]RUS63570.1 N-acetyltransferase [Pseudorhodobacter sp. E13]